jgi:hypothetical protein
MGKFNRTNVIMVMNYNSVKGESRTISNISYRRMVENVREKILPGNAGGKLHTRPETYQEILYENSHDK